MRRSTVRIRRVAVTTAVLLLFCPIIRGEEQMLFDANACASTEAARKSWTPGDRGTTAVDLVTVGGKKMLELPLNFRTNKEWRVCCDLKGKWDLADLREIVVDVTVPGKDAERMTIYLHTRGGWFRGTFAAPPGTSAIALPRKRFKTEQDPANWYEVDRLRLSINHGEAVDRKVRVASIRAECEPLHVALWRGQKTNRYLVRNASSMLDDLGIIHETVSDADIAAGRLRGKKMLIALVGSGSSPKTADELKRFADAGGKTLPLTWDDARGNKQALLTRIGEAWPGVWEDLYERGAREFGRLAGCENIDELERFARELAGNDQGRRLDAVCALFTTARGMLKWSEEAADQKKMSVAWERIEEARRRAGLALFNAVAPRDGEFRAVWCHKPTGVDGMTWDEAMKTLSDNGFNAIIVNMSWGYAAAYPSDVLPFSARLEKKDWLAECIAAAKKYDIAVHVWRVNWNLAWHASKGDREKLRAEGRLQVGPDGEPVDWLCPSNPLNRKLEIDAMLEVVRKYDVAGIHFDYIRYPGRGSCYCGVCRKAFEKSIGEKVANWPADVRTGPLKEKYLQYRRDTISPVVEAVHREAHRIKPGIKVSAAVFPYWTSARDDQGQDWKMWVEKGWLDFVCPMQYTTDAREFEHMTKQSTEWVGGRIPLFPGIGATLGQKPDDTLLQILAVRKAAAPGFVLFGYYRPLVEKTFPWLKEGPTSKKTTYTFPSEAR